MSSNQHRREDPDFAKWLRRTVRKLKNGDLPPESWEQRHSPLEDSAAQRRIARLIASIAERSERPTPRRPRRR
jgi:hypothetical protein